MYIIKQFTEFLATKRRQLTDHSAQVVTAVFSRPGMSSAEEIVEAVRGTVSRATTYRTLRSLVEANLLRQVQLGGQLFYFAPDFKD